MKMKKLVSILLSLALMVALFAGCGESVVVVPGEKEPAGTNEQQTPSPAVTDETPADPGPVEREDVKTGLSVSISMKKSADATAEKAGLAQTDITLVAVTVGEDGVIDDCVIDTIQAKINFDTTGKITTPLDTEFPAKNELGDAYGMKKASSIGKEWNEQAAALADYVKGKTLEQVKGIALNESGKAADADLAASVTVSIGGYLSGIEAAVNNAQHMGAAKGDELYLTSVTTIAKSKDAGEKDGTAQAYATFGAFTMYEDMITGCYIDAVQANVNFNTSGAITSDLTAHVATKNELGEGYGMKKASSIGKEWNEQAAAFCTYVVGKTASEVAGIAVTDGKAADADLAASVTIGIGDFQALIAKSGK